VAEKKKTDIDLPFLRVREDEEGSYVKVGPIEVTDKKAEKEKVRIGPLHIDESGVRMERSLNSKLEGMAWAFFFIMIGCVWLFENVYHVNLPGIAAIGIGVIWLALNYTRSRLDIKTSTFTIVLGIAFIIYGLAEWFVVEIGVLPVIAIAVGAYLIITFARRV